jgi:hypothetical protein
MTLIRDSYRSLVAEFVRQLRIIDDAVSSV